MPRWVRDNGALLGAVAAVLGIIGGAGAGFATLYTRAALADVTTRVSVLEANRTNDAKATDEIKDRLKRIEDKQDRILERLP